jgi:hypothetical protein
MPWRLLLLLLLQLRGAPLLCCVREPGWCAPRCRVRRVPRA